MNGTYKAWITQSKWINSNIPASLNKSKGYRALPETEQLISDRQKVVAPQTEKKGNGFLERKTPRIYRIAKEK
jgi:hypothetical protein